MPLFKSPASPRTSCVAIIRQLPNLVMQLLSYRSVGRFETVHPVVRGHDGSRHSIDRSVKTTKSAEMSVNQEPAKQHSQRGERNLEDGALLSYTQHRWKGHSKVDSSDSLLALKKIPITWSHHQHTRFFGYRTPNFPTPPLKKKSKPLVIWHKIGHVKGAVPPSGSSAIHGLPFSPS